MELFNPPYDNYLLLRYGRDLNLRIWSIFQLQHQLGSARR